jgi:hypothetical protein
MYVGHSPLETTCASKGGRPRYRRKSDEPRVVKHAISLEARQKNQFRHANRFAETRLSSN